MKPTHLKHKNPLNYSPQVLIKLLPAIGLFQKKSKQGANFRQNEASPLDIPQNCVTPIGIFKARDQDLLEISHDFFLTIPGNSFSFFYWPLEFSHTFFSITWEIPYPQPHCLIFSWNSSLLMLCLRNFVPQDFRFYPLSLFLCQESVL